jgi:CBS domain-containing protein
MTQVETTKSSSDLDVRPADPVRLIMSSPIASLDVGSTLREASEEMARNDIGAVLVSDGAQNGLISERDIVNVLGAHGDVGTIQVDQAVTWDLVWADPDDSILMVGGLMLEANVRHIPIGNSRTGPIGIVSIRDVLAVFMAESRLAVR